MIRKTAVWLSHLLLVASLSDAVGQDLKSSVEIESTYSITSDITYHRASGIDLKLDLYRPGGSDRPAPVLVYCHGGGWVVGDRHSSSLLFLPYLERGFAVANVSYRLAKTAPAPAAVVDALCALKWVARNAEARNLDPERIVVSGHSAGGHLALIVALLPADAPYANECASFQDLFDNRVPAARPAAVVNWFGISDVADLLVEPNRQLYAQQWLGGQLNKTEIAQSVSPIQYVREDLPPVLTIHGNSDPIVPYEHAVRLNAAMTAAGAVSELITVPEGGHDGFSVSQLNDIYERVWSFLREHALFD